MTVGQSTEQQCTRIINWFLDNCLRDFWLLLQKKKQIGWQRLCMISATY